MIIKLQYGNILKTINNYWKNLGKSKIRLGGNGKYASGILTKPGTAPTTFNGLNINYITSPKGGNVTHKFYTDLGSEYILTKDGFARRIKSPHSNVEGSDSGLHDWNEGTTIFTKGEDGKLFNTAFYKFSDFGFKPGTYGLVRQNGKAKIMLIDPKTKLWREAMFSDAYPTSVKLGLLLDRVLSVDYSNVPFIGGHILEKTSGSWHPGSSVAFIEGLKQGGFIKTARKRKHEDEEEIKYSDPLRRIIKKHLTGGKTTFGLKIGNFLNSDTGKSIIDLGSQLYNGISSSIEQLKLNDKLLRWKQSYINSIQPEDFSLLIKLEEERLKQENPDYNSSPIVEAYKQNRLASNALMAARQKASQEADLYIQLLLLQQTPQSSFGDIIAQGLGTVGTLLSNKKLATS